MAAQVASTARGKDSDPVTSEGQARGGPELGEGASQQKHDQAGDNSSSRRLLVLLHGEKASDDLVRSAIARLRSEGHKILVRVTYEAGDVDRLVKEALALKSADTLVAAGGDGTINEVVAALLKHTGGLKDTRDLAKEGISPQAHAEGRPPVLKALSVGILPMGTSNDFAATTGIPQDPYEALKIATQKDSLKQLDVGLLNGQVFMNTATIGASADIGKVTSSNIKRVLGPAAFLVTGARAVGKWAPIPSIMAFPNQSDTPETPLNQTINVLGRNWLRYMSDVNDPQGRNLAHALSKDVPEAGAVEVTPEGKTTSMKQRGDGTQEPAGSKEEVAGRQPSESSKIAAAQTQESVGELEGVPLLHITAANNRQVASMVSVAPNALLDDGALDCVYVTGDTKEQFKRMLWDLITKGPNRTAATHALLRVPWLEVQTEKPMEWSLDGEAQAEPSTNFRFSLLHKAVQFHLPDDRMLVAGNMEPETTDEQTQGNKSRRRFRLPRGKLHAPSLGDMIGRVVRFRKKKNWKKIINDGIKSTLKNLFVAGLGGLAVHFWHERHHPDRSLEARASQAVSHLDSARKRVGRSLSGKRRHTAVA